VLLSSVAPSLVSFQSLAGPPFLPSQLAPATVTKSTFRTLLALAIRSNIKRRDAGSKWRRRSSSATARDKRRGHQPQCHLRSSIFTTFRPLLIRGRTPCFSPRTIRETAEKYDLRCSAGDDVVALEQNNRPSVARYVVSVYGVSNSWTVQSVGVRRYCDLCAVAVSMYLVIVTTSTCEGAKRRLIRASASNPREERPKKALRV
jgi:hypothetical protein